MADDTAKPAALKLLSYNIQVGLHTRDFGHMVSGAWRHVWPSRDQRANLERIAELIADYDVVAIQEADAGSLRTRAMNQIEFLAERAGFNHCGYIVTRDLQPVARHCHGWMSRVAPLSQESHILPARIPGRAAMRIEFGGEMDMLSLVAAHLSLGPRDRRRQLDYLADLAGPRQRTLLVGDLNSGSDFLRAHPALRARGFQPVNHAPKTYPSWQPRRALDQVLHTPDIDILRVDALPLKLSDHAPLAVQLRVTGNGAATHVG